MPQVFCWASRHKLDSRGPTHRWSSAHGDLAYDHGLLVEQKWWASTLHFDITLRMAEFLYWWSSKVRQELSPITRHCSCNPLSATWSVTDTPYCVAKLWCSVGKVPLVHFQLTMALRSACQPHHQMKSSGLISDYETAIIIRQKDRLLKLSCLKLKHDWLHTKC